MDTALKCLNPKKAGAGCLPTSCPEFMFEDFGTLDSFFPIVFTVRLRQLVTATFKSNTSS